ncbi:hypothetical protein J2S63_003363 [Marmoricola bigeumensis]|uniref:Glycosyltransferase 2-like domain-containing protein n=1 Tax=Nocardioides marmoribigeumensis TaxID=433649 RepID=A0ABU2BZI2_9ACTN|nr:hypothetical protein [Nocardioides marmoribigeumensis]
MTPRAPLRCLLLGDGPTTTRLADLLVSSGRVEVLATRRTAGPAELRALSPDVLVLVEGHRPTATLLAAWWLGLRLVRARSTGSVAPAAPDRLDRRLGVRPLEVADAATTARDLALLAGRPGRGAQGGRPVSVVVPALDEVRVIDQVLEPLLPQLTPDDEVLVVDSGSVDGTRDRLRS